MVRAGGLGARAPGFSPVLRGGWGGSVGVSDPTAPPDRERIALGTEDGLFVLHLRTNGECQARGVGVRSVTPESLQIDTSI